MVLRRAQTRRFFRPGGVGSEKEGLRRAFEKCMERAAEAGFEDAARLGECTPAEIELKLRAFAARERRRWERLDAAAWLAARYAAVGWHAPSRFPRRPDGVRRGAMTDEEMKQVFTALAQRGTMRREEKP